MDSTGPGRNPRRVTSPNWTRLAAYVARYRVLAGYPTTRAFAAAIGIHEKTLGRLESGKSVNRNTLTAVEAGLKWSPGSAAAVLAGGEPTLERPAGVERARQEIAAMTEDDLAVMHARIEAVSGQPAADSWVAGARQLARAAKSA